MSIVIVLASCSLASAQQVGTDPSFERMRTELKIGDRLTVDLMNGSSVEGRLIDAGPDTMSILDRHRRPPPVAARGGPCPSPWPWDRSGSDDWHRSRPGAGAAMGAGPPTKGTIATVPCSGYVPGPRGRNRHRRPAEHSADRLSAAVAVAHVVQGGSRSAPDRGPRRRQVLNRAFSCQLSAVGCQLCSSRFPLLHIVSTSCFCPCSFRLWRNSDSLFGTLSTNVSCTTSSVTATLYECPNHQYSP